MLQTQFTCTKCGALFTPKNPNMARYKLRKRGTIYCSKGCASTTHGGFKDKMPEYASWAAMKNRCDHPGSTHYSRYGGRGITYNKSWGNFEQFLIDMGKMPEENMELDRIDNDGNYCKENCRWATRKEQTRNRGGARATRLYTFNGKTMCIADWAKEIGITPQSLQKRLNNGWPLEIALDPQKRDGGDRSKWVASPVSPTKGETIRNKNSKFITIDGITKTYSEWEKEKGLSKGLISKRLQQGLSPYDAVMRPINRKP